MYSRLLRVVSPGMASAILTVWYALLMLLVLLSVDAPRLPFRYGGM